MTRREGVDEEGEAMYTFHVWGVRRSGNHAIIGWILEHVGAPFVHLNDIQDVHNPLTPSGVSVSGIPAWRYKRGLLRKARHFFVSRYQAKFAGADPSVDYEGLISIPGLACRVFSYEDRPLTSVDGTSVLLLRDPFNLFASLLKAGYFDERLDDLPEIYANHAECFRQQWNNPSLVGINYNEWFQDAEYRVSIARQLGFDTDGRPYDDVPWNGGGSSFSGQAYRGHASRMDVLSRWQSVADRADFQRLITEPRVRAAAEAIFPALAEEVYAAVDARRRKAFPARR